MPEDIARLPPLVAYKRFIRKESKGPEVPHGIPMTEEQIRALGSANTAPMRSRAGEGTAVSGRVAGAIEQGEFAAETLQHHFRGIAVLPRLVLPFSDLFR